MRVIFDTSVLIRAALGSTGIVRVIHRSLDPRVIIITNEMLIAEFAITLRKPRLATSIDRNVASQLLSFLTLNGEQVPITPPFPECRDPADAYLLAMAEAGRADYLVTFDRDLLTMGTIGFCTIASPDDYLNAMPREF